MELSFRNFLELHKAEPNLQHSMARYLGIDPASVEKVGGQYLPNATLGNISYNGLHLQIVDVMKDKNGKIVRAKLKVADVPGTVASGKSGEKSVFVPSDTQVGKTFYVGEKEFLQLLSPTAIQDQSPMGQMGQMGIAPPMPM